MAQVASACGKLKAERAADPVRSAGHDDIVVFQKHLALSFPERSIYAAAGRSRMFSC